MAQPEYRWRHLTPKERSVLLKWRIKRRHPWHSPPHRPNFGHLRFHITSACFEHHPYIGQSYERMDLFASELLAVLSTHSQQVFGWCLLPNHYHVLVEARDVLALLKQIGLFHGRTSYAWNGEDNSRRRKVFFRAVERAMKSDRHYWATLNYVHHNPVHHGYVERLTTENSKIAENSNSLRSLRSLRLNPPPTWNRILLPLALEFR